MLFNPVAGAMSLTLIIGAFFLAGGIINFAHGIRHRKEQYWGWFIVNGIVDLILGALIVVGWPVTALWVIGTFVGIQMFLYGATWTTMSSVFRKIEKEMPPSTT
jgi:uncharacterized membrane protein HdeD (DUF308 family)